MISGGTKVLGYLAELAKNKHAVSTVVRPAKEGHPPCIAVYLVGDFAMKRYSPFMLEAVKRLALSDIPSEISSHVTIAELFDWVENNKPHWGFIPVYLGDKSKATVAFFAGTDICTFIADGLRKRGLEIELVKSETSAIDGLPA